MKRLFTSIKLLVPFLLVTFFPSLCLAQDQSPAPTGQVIFEISLKTWDVYASDDCKLRLHLSFYSNGRVVYEGCQENSSNSGKPSYSVVRKETKVQEKDIAELKQLIEESGFPQTQGRLRSELLYEDSGYIITLVYYVNGGQRTLEVVNYIQASKVLPDWLHKIIGKAFEFMPPDK